MSTIVFRNISNLVHGYQLFIATCQVTEELKLVVLYSFSFQRAASGRIHDLFRTSCTKEVEINMANLLRSQLVGYLRRQDGPLWNCGGLLECTNL